MKRPRGQGPRFQEGPRGALPAHWNRDSPCPPRPAYGVWPLRMAVHIQVAVTSHPKAMDWPPGAAALPAGHGEEGPQWQESGPSRLPMTVSLDMVGKSVSPKGMWLLKCVGVHLASVLVNTLSVRSARGASSREPDPLEAASPRPRRARILSCEIRSLAVHT